MNLSCERRQRATETGRARSQLVTLAVEPARSRGEADPVRLILLVIEGVEAVEPDPASARVWVFGNGAVEPESLVDALASWGYGACVLDDQLTVPE